MTSKDIEQEDIDMMTEEQKIKQMTHREAGFKVPEGYFENFTQRMMERIPEEQTVYTPLWSRWIHSTAVRIAAAAMFVGVIGTVCLTVGSRSTARETAQEEQGEYIDDALDYAMINNNEIYMYLSENH
jgi:hypothetical protein